MSRRIGILGGSFDPVHYGHLIMAESARIQCRLEAVWFLPTSMNPLKHDGPSATAQQRIDMLELAIGGHDAFEVCRSEVDRDGIPGDRQPHANGDITKFEAVVVRAIFRRIDAIRQPIDLGPEGGDKGGQIVACGTPEEVAQHPTSHTGRYLAKVLEQHPPEVDVPLAA